MNFASGKLNKIISIKRPTMRVTDYGSTESVLTTIASVRANVTHGRGLRTITNDEVFFTANVNFTIRLGAIGISQNDVISYDGKDYRILDIWNDTDKQCTKITTELINE